MPILKAYRPKPPVSYFIAYEVTHDLTLKAEGHTKLDPELDLISYDSIEVENDDEIRRTALARISFTDVICYGSPTNPVFRDSVRRSRSYLKVPGEDDEVASFIAVDSLQREDISTSSQAMLDMLAPWVLRVMELTHLSAESDDRS